MNALLESTPDETRATPATFHLTENDIREFQRVVNESCGLWMTPAEAAVRAKALLSLASIIIGTDESEQGFIAVQTSSHLSGSQ